MPPPDPPRAGADPQRQRFERCFEQHYRRLLAFALRRVSGREAAEDAVAETFAVAWRRREQLPEQPLPWLYAVALRVIANQRRSAQRRRGLDDRLRGEVAVPDAWTDPAERLAERDAFFAAFRRLDEREREALRLVAWEGLSSRDAARAMGCSAGAFRVRLHRARRRLAKQLAAAGHPMEEQPTPIPKPTEETS